MGPKIDIGCTKVYIIFYEKNIIQKIFLKIYKNKCNINII